MPVRKRRRARRIVKIPPVYLEAVELGNVIFPVLFQFENGLRLILHTFLTTCYGPDWWELSLKDRLPDIHRYSTEQQTRRNAMPWIGASARVPIMPIHLVTLGQLEEIVKIYRSDCIPQLFPTLEFFLGHMEAIKRVRNLYSHMFPCITRADCILVRREIATLAMHINTKLQA